MDIDALVAQLTLEEKVSLCLGADFWRTNAVERLGIGAVWVSDGPHGLRAQPQEADHLGLNGSLPATCFPTAAGLGTSWNRDLFARVGAAIAREAKHVGISVVLGPGINIKRSPLCGRNFEYVSEDPFLSGALATAMVASMQDLGIGTSLKHFAANNQEDDRLRVSAEVDERTLREIYLPAFEAVVKDAQPWTVMCAYNKLNGTYASEHHWLLTEILRDEWGFEGLVVSDWGAVHDRVAALAAGLDLEMPPKPGRSDAEVVAAVKNGSLSYAAVDLMARRMLRLVDQAQPALAEGGTFDEAEHHAIARAAARESAVLLKNDGAVLPLVVEPGQTVAVIGEFARTPRFQGAGSSQVTPTFVDLPLDQLTEGFGADVAVRFAAGYRVDGEREADDLVPEAVAAAAGADHVIVFLGLPAAYESEGFDRGSMDLPADQLAVLEAVAAVHPRVVVVLVNGSVVTMATWDRHAAAVLECWLGGQAGGGAIADLLLGVANPSGKLAETVPLRLEDNSAYLNFPGDSGVVRYGEGLFVGYRSYDALDQQVSYPFGFGLSYTTFALDRLRVKVHGKAKNDTLTATVSVTVTNTGDRAGAEVVQVYVGDPDSSAVRPVRELKGFAKVELAPGESRQVSIELDQRAFSYWSIRLHRWVVEGGEFDISVGTSSRHRPLTESVTVRAPSVAPPLTTESTLLEWLTDDAGRKLLMASAGHPALQDEALIKIIGTMPLSTLAAFGMGFTFEQLDELIKRL